MRVPNLLVLLLLVGLSGCSSVAQGGATAHAGEQPATSFVVVGDSITAGTEPMEGRQIVGQRSWVPAAEGAPLDFRGGLAVPGATTTYLRDGVTPLEADVLVLLAGTNDITQRMPWEASRVNLETIVGTAGVPDVLLVAIGSRGRSGVSGGQAPPPSRTGLSC
jgi:hypothetical protein